MDSSILSFNAEKYVFSWLLAYLSWSFWSLLYLRFRGTQERIWAIVQKFPTKCFRSDSGPAPQSLSPTFVFLKGIKVYLAISGRFCTVQTLQDQKFNRSKFCLIFKAVYTVQEMVWYCLHKSYFLKRSLVSYLSQFQCRKVRFSSLTYLHWSFCSISYLRFQHARKNLSNCVNAWGKIHPGFFSYN